MLTWFTESYRFNVVYESLVVNMFCYHYSCLFICFAISIDLYNLNITWNFFFEIDKDVNQINFKIHTPTWLIKHYKREKDLIRKVNILCSFCCLPYQNIVNFTFYMFRNHLIDKFDYGSRHAILQTERFYGRGPRKEIEEIITNYN